MLLLVSELFSGLGPINHDKCENRHSVIVFLTYYKVSQCIKKKKRHILEETHTQWTTSVSRFCDKTSKPLDSSSNYFFESVAHLWLDCISEFVQNVPVCWQHDRRHSTQHGVFIPVMFELLKFSCPTPTWWCKSCFPCPISYINVIHKIFDDAGWSSQSPGICNRARNVCYEKYHMINSTVT